MKLSEIFYSLQGEGVGIGIPTCFIRTSGCNLRCSWCDTKYALRLENGKAMPISQILTAIEKYPTRYVCITGGEPLLQEKTPLLIEKLLKRRYKVNLETNGSFSIKHIVLSKNLLISLDVKCPSSQMHKRMRLENIKLLRAHDQLKFVLKDLRDYTYAKGLVREYKPRSEVIFIPLWGTNANELIKNLLKDGINARFLPQLHKILEIP